MGSGIINGHVFCTSSKKHWINVNNIKDGDSRNVTRFPNKSKDNTRSDHTQTTNNKDINRRANTSSAQLNMKQGGSAKEFEGITTFELEGEVYSLCKGNADLYAVGVGGNSSPYKIHIIEYSNSKIILSVTGHSNIIWRGYGHKKSDSLLSGCWDSDIRIWNYSNGNCFAILKGHSDFVRDIVELRSGDIITVSDDGSIKYWNMDTFECYKTIKDAHSTFINIALLLKENKQGVTGGNDEQGKIWKTALNSKEDISNSINTGSSIMSGVEVTNNRGLAGLLSGDIGVYNINGLTQVGRLQQHTSYVYIMMLLSDGNGITGSIDSNLIIWDVDSLSFLQNFHQHKSDIYTSGIEMRGNEIMLGSFDKTVKTWIRK